MAFTWNLSLPAASPRQTLRLFLFSFAAGLHDNDSSRRREPQRQEGPGGNGPLSQEWLGGSGKGLLIEQSSGLLTAPA